MDVQTVVKLSGLRSLATHVYILWRSPQPPQGHILGTPKRIVGSERELSPTMLSLLRFILHSAMLSAAQEQPEVDNRIVLNFDSSKAIYFSRQRLFHSLIINIERR